MNQTQISDRERVLDLMKVVYRKKNLRKFRRRLILARYGWG